MTDSCCPLILSGGARGSAGDTAGRRELAADKHIGEKKHYYYFFCSEGRHFKAQRHHFQTAAGGHDLNFTPRAKRRSNPAMHWRSFHPLLPRQHHLQMDKTRSASLLAAAAGQKGVGGKLIFHAAASNEQIDK